MTIKDVYRIKPFRTLVSWIVCSLFAWPLTAIALALIFLPLSIMMGPVLGSMMVNTGWDQPAPSYNIWLAGALLFGAGLLVGAVIGTVIGHLQHWLLRTHHFWAADHWRRWSMIGGVLAMAAVLAFIFVSTVLDVDSDTQIYLMPPLFLMIFGAVQVRMLRNAVKQAWLWIAANTVGGVVFVGLLANNTPEGHLMTILLALIAAASMGFIMGAVMIFLFENHLLPMEAEGAENEADATPQRRSVWDEVV